MWSSLGNPHQSSQHTCTPNWVTPYYPTTAAVSSSTATVDWFSDWRTSFGTSQNALWDGVNPWKFNDEIGTSFLLSVITATGLGFPSAMSRCLRVDGDHGTSSRKVEARTVGVLPAVGAYQFYRFYQRNSVGTSIELGGAHVYESMAGYLEWAWKPMDMQSGGTYAQRIYLHGVNNPDSGSFYEYSALTQNTVYRCELRMYRSSASSFQAYVRVYGGDDTTLIADATNFTRVVAPNGTLAADASDVTISSITQALQSVDCGNPNQAGSIWTAGNYMYLGGLAMRQSTNSAAWIGAYPATGET